MSKSINMEQPSLKQGVEILCQWGLTQEAQGSLPFSVSTLKRWRSLGQWLKRIIAASLLYSSGDLTKTERGALAVLVRDALGLSVKLGSKKLSTPKVSKCSHMCDMC